MSILVGQCLTEPVTGAVGRAFDFLRNDPQNGLLPEAFIEGTLSRQLLARVVTAITQGVIEEIQAHGVAHIVISQGSLQRDPLSSEDTLAPSSPQTIVGTIT